MAIISDGWCRLEGAKVLNFKKTYGYDLISPITTVFYGPPSVQIYSRNTDPNNLIHGVAYKVVTIKDLCGFSTIEQIDNNYSTLQNAITAYDKTINIAAATNAAQLYRKEFVVVESSIIFYADSTQGKFDKWTVVFVDESVAPPIIAISAKYKGESIPVGLTFDVADLEVFAEYEDGNINKIVSGYSIDPADRIITKVGNNIFKIGFIDNTGYSFPPAPVAIIGIKRLMEISGIYDGPAIYPGHVVERRYLTIVGHYSDGSSSTVTSYGFPNGNILGNPSNPDSIISTIMISHNGKYCNVDIPMYVVESSRLVAYYTGPAVEVDPYNPQSFDTSQTRIQIFYQSRDGLNSGWENLTYEMCEFTPTVIDHEGVNIIHVSYMGKSGRVSCEMIVNGVSPDVVMTQLQAVYTGPPIVQNNSYSLERLIVKAYYSDGTVVSIKNGYSVNKQVVSNVGDNVFVCRYTDRPSSGKDVTLETTFIVVGTTTGDTTDSNYTPVTLQNFYPDATRLNNRFRGPAEGVKYSNINFALYHNINSLYKIFTNIEKNFNALIDSIDSQSSFKYNSISQLNRAKDSIIDIKAYKL